jgi:hypothetical protein
MPLRSVLEQDRIELVFSGTLRRTADYRMEDASAVVLGQIAERITRRNRWAWGRGEPARPHVYEVTDASGALVASSLSKGTWSSEVRGEINDAHGVTVGRISRPRRGPMFPLDVEGSGSVSGMQIIQRSRESYAVQFVTRAGEQAAEIEPTGSSAHGWRHQFLSYQVNFASLSDRSHRIFVLGAFPILHMTYVAPRG